MKYIITGSLGNISLPITKNLLAAGQDVTVISSSEEKRAAIETLGAKAAIGSISDAVFLEGAFKDADVAYLMIPQNLGAADYFKFQQKVADDYVQAISTSNIKHLVLLSSIGAHLRKDSGPIDGLGYLEEKLSDLQGVHIKILRPSYFFANLYSQAGLIKYAGITGSNFGNSDEKMVLVHTDDIAAQATEFLLNPAFTGTTITYIAGDERHPNEIAAVLGKAVGKEGTPWITFTDEEFLKGLVDAGFPPAAGALYVQMGKAIREGKLQEEYWKNRPETLGKYKLEDFAKDFAVAYQKS